MNLTGVRLVGLSTTVIDLPILGAGDPDNKFQLKNIDGLDPPDIDVSISNALNQGGVYQNRTPQDKEIVIRVGFNPDYTTGQTISDLRTMLYALLSPYGFMSSAGDHLTVIFLDGVTELVRTIGWVKKMEASPFSKDPEVQITIQTDSPYLHGPQPPDMFPDKSLPILVNPGNAPTGFHMELAFTVDHPAGLELVSFESGQFMAFIHPFIAGDWLKFDTRPGHRSVVLNHLGVDHNLIGSLYPQSDWTMLHGGENPLSIFPAGGGFNWVTVYIIPEHWGI